MDKTTFIDSAFIALSAKEIGYDYNKVKKRENAQNGEIMRVYYSHKIKAYFGVLSIPNPKSKRLYEMATFTGTFMEVIKLVDEIFNTEDIVYLRFVRPIIYPKHKEESLQKVLKDTAKTEDINNLKKFLLLLL